MTEKQECGTDASFGEFFALTLKYFSSRGQFDTAGSLLYGQLTDILQSGDFNECEDILCHVDVDEINLTLLTALLMGTARMPRDLLPSRPTVFDRIREKYVRDRGEKEAAAALDYLE